jgi:hypothetical protein
MYDILIYHTQKVERFSSLIVTYSLEITTSLIGEFLGENLPIWQVLGSFSAIRDGFAQAAIARGSKFRGIGIY